MTLRLPVLPRRSEWDPSYILTYDFMGDSFVHADGLLAQRSLPLRSAARQEVSQQGICASPKP